MWWPKLCCIRACHVNVLGSFHACANDFITTSTSMRVASEVQAWHARSEPARRASEGERMGFPLLIMPQALPTIHMRREVPHVKGTNRDLVNNGDGDPDSSVSMHLDSSVALLAPSGAGRVGHDRRVCNNTLAFSGHSQRPSSRESRHRMFVDEENGATVH